MLYSGLRRTFEALQRVTALVIFCGTLPNAFATPAPALNDRVLVVYNAAESASRSVADHYIAARSIPSLNLCKIRTSATDHIEEDEFRSAVKAPIQACLNKAGKDNILYIVFSYGTPFDLVINGQTYALDQFVADIWDSFLAERPANQPETQPYFGQAQSQGGVYQPYVPFSTYRETAGARKIYSVWRLDGPTAAIAKDLVDKAVFAETHKLSGQVCIDRRYANLDTVSDFSYGAGDWDLFQAGDLARKAGFSVLEDSHEQEFGTPPAPARCDNAALYAGWYSLNHYNDAFSWNPGAIGIHLDSASAQNPREGPNWAANALAKGITVTSGAVAEPYLENLPHPDQVFLYLFQGANVGDALLRSTRMLKWKIINIGDPLYRPFPGGISLSSPPSAEVVLGLTPAVTSANMETRAVIGLNRRPPAGGIQFAIKTSRPDLVEVPPTVTLPESSNYVVFPIKTKGSPEKATPISISVSGQGLSRSNTLVAYPGPDRAAQ